MELWGNRGDDKEARRYLTAFSERGGNVTGLGQDYVPGSWPEFTLLALQFKQEPPFHCK